MVSCTGIAHPLMAVWDSPTRDSIWFRQPNCVKLIETSIAHINKGGQLYYLGE